MLIENEKKSILMFMSQFDIFIFQKSWAFNILDLQSFKKIVQLIIYLWAL